MERLHTENDLEKYLLKQRGRSITIVSAFASGTVKLLKSVAAENDVEVIVGTINSFTSPTFIDDARTLLKRRLWVDFRGNASIHWKLYLVSPDIVVIGSANFTNLGVGMGRDTCVVIQDRNLYDEYQKQVEILKRDSEVMDEESVGFDDALARHRQQHNRNQAALQIAHQGSQSALPTGTRRVPSFDVWAKQGFLTIPLFVWEETHTELVKAEAARIMYDQDAVAKHVAGDAGEPANSEVRPYRDFLTEEIDGPKPSFDPNTVVLATKATGAYMRFMQLDVVVRKADLGIDFMIERRKRRYPQSFEITPAIKSAITRLIEKGKCQHYAIPVEALQEELLHG
ncbi:phospholipase D family protein [Stutzerimonas stutzeri]|uniref:phospholipase D family protein n=1 Tax=Stutzerimonas stutzeri TaxID=316 RepID=UPI00210B41E3|nr:phospholipase D family protein [Stutzerimonas stutzeri]MCQ4256495.1 phospholipase D family protein [Stutzerimonas stutzeri]